MSKDTQCRPSCSNANLSLELNEELQLMNVLMLNGNKISHLLYADDLVLLALDAECLQKLISKLEDLCSLWELTVNMTKTEVMVFNSQGRMLNCSKGFKFGPNPIQATRSYTYLGITELLRPKKADQLEVPKKIVDNKASRCPCYTRPHVRLPDMDATRMEKAILANTGHGK